MAMCFDSGASPQVRFTGVPEQVGPGRVPCGWGFGWYPEADRAVSVVKDPNSRGDGPMVRMLQDWSHFRSTIFLSFVLGAAQRRTQQDTHPFQLRHAGRDWLLSHNGALKGFKTKLPLGPQAPYEPAGRTDSEHALCWLGARLREKGATRLADLGWAELHKLFQQINELGTANLAFTDGLDLVFYHDAQGFREVRWTRRLPTQKPAQIHTGLICLDLDDAVERGRSVVLFSTLSPDEEDWEPMKPGQMLVARRGTVIWDSMKNGAPSTNGAARHVKTKPAPSRPSALYRIEHETIYRYVKPVERSSHVFRLRPVHDRYQEVLEHGLELSVRGPQRDYEDVFGNQSVALDVETPFDELRVVSRNLVRVRALQAESLEFPNRRMSIPLVWMPWQRQMMAPYLLPVELSESQLLELSDYAMAAVERNDFHLVDTLTDLNTRIHQDFEYVPKSTTLATTPYDVFWTRRGVCQDFANLLICLARLLAIPARYRVGYIRTGADYANKLQSEASHAWVECYLPWMGWFGLDPTNGRQAGLDHVRVACGRSYIDATPTSGTIYRGGGEETLDVRVRLEQVE